MVRMLEEFQSDLVVGFLLKKSNLSEAQLDTVLAFNHEGNFESKRALRRKRVSKGAFARTLKQARRNIECSVCTLLLLAYLEQVPAHKIAQFGRIARMLYEVRKAGPSNEELQRIIDGMELFLFDFVAERKVIL